MIQPHPVPSFRETWGMARFHYCFLFPYTSGWSVQTASTSAAAVSGTPYRAWDLRKFRKRVMTPVFMMSTNMAPIIGTIRNGLTV